MNLPQKSRRFYAVLKKDGVAGLARVFRRRLIRSLGGGLWDGYKDEALSTSKFYDFSLGELQKSNDLQKSNNGLLTIRKVTWFIPDFQNPNYGGIHTILRFANYLTSHYKIENEFALIGSMPEAKIKKLIGTAFNTLRNSLVLSINGVEDFEKLSNSDAAIATLWSTAYFLLRFNSTKRKFYFIQDFESLFYPAGTIQALVDTTYRFGFYGLTNTPPLCDIYREAYGGDAQYFNPCVDTNIFFPAQNKSLSDKPYKLFFYGRPDHPRNGFEMGIEALRKVKHRFGDEIEIVAAGANWQPSDYSLKGVVKNLGILPLLDTAKLYRSSDAGFVLMFTRHPSYIPFELMASKTLVITNENKSTSWFLKNNENCLLAYPSASSISEQIEFALRNVEFGRNITSQAYDYVINSYSNWNDEFYRLFQYMKSPK